MAKLGAIRPNPFNAVRFSFDKMIEAYQQYRVIREVETTKREHIRMQSEVDLARLKAQRDIVEQYLTNTFKERAYMIEGMFRALEQGIASDNDRVIDQALNGIVAIARTSPLLGVNEVMNQLDDPGVDCIEI